MENKNYSLGLVSVSFRKHSPREIVEAAAAAGLSCIEWGSDVHAPCLDRERLLEIVALQEEFGLRCSSYGTYFRLGQTPLSELPDYIAAAKLLGTNILRLWCGTKSGAEFSDEEREAFFDECRRAAAIAREENVILCMECHVKTFTQRLEDTLALMVAVDDPHFRMYWQPFQWQTPEENLVYAEALAPLSYHIHVFQWKDRLRFPLADGIAEWQGYLEKFPTPRTLLLEFMPDDLITTLPAEAEALRAIIGGNR